MFGELEEKWRDMWQIGRFSLNLFIFNERCTLQRCCNLFICVWEEKNKQRIEIGWCTLKLLLSEDVIVNENGEGDEKQFIFLFSMNIHWSNQRLKDLFVLSNDDIILFITNMMAGIILLSHRIDYILSAKLTHLHTYKPTLPEKEHSSSSYVVSQCCPDIVFLQYQGRWCHEFFIDFFKEIHHQVRSITLSSHDLPSNSRARIHVRGH